MHKKRSRSAYESFWEKIIQPQIDVLCRQDGVSCPHPERVKKDIFRAYKAFNKHCSENYMWDAEKLLDRHKVAACYTYAIVAVRPLKIDDFLIDEIEDSLARNGCLEGCRAARVALSNGRLALTSGCSIMVSYTRENLSRIELSETERESVRPLLKGGVRFPEETDVAHGSYPLTTANYLCFSAAERHFDIPLLGLVYYHLERESFLDGGVFRKMQELRPQA